MSVGVLLVTHGLLGEDIRHTAVQMLSRLPLPTEAVTVHLDSDPQKIRQTITTRLKRLDHSAGVLVLTDAYGSTPCNVAVQAGSDYNCRIVAGLNVPMLVRVYNYPQASLQELARIAHEGGRRGVLVCEQE
jgi:PTS system ascorbate-specific IIA component